MLTYKEVYENRNVGKVVSFFSIEDIERYANETWAYSPNCHSTVYPQEQPFVPGEYFVSEKEFISGHCSEVIVAIVGVFKTATKSVFVAGKIYNESLKQTSNHVWKYFFRIKD